MMTKSTGSVREGTSLVFFRRKCLDNQICLLLLFYLELLAIPIRTQGYDNCFWHALNYTRAERGRQGLSHTSISRRSMSVETVDRKRGHPWRTKGQSPS